ncbi:MAG: hypothetical protein IJS09_03265 [Treponema sp.]|nr:hypothetical protein [Treponema sp.]
MKKNIQKRLLLLVALAMVIGLFGCNNADDAANAIGGYSVTVYASTNGTSKVYAVTDGTTFSQMISGNSIVPSAASENAGYVFTKWVRSDWSDFSTSSKITSDITVFALFTKTETTSEKTVKTYLRGDKQMKKEEKVNQTTVTNSDGSTTTKSSETVVNPNGTTTETSKETTVATDGTKTEKETVKNSDGSEKTTETKTQTASDGTKTIAETVTEKNTSGATTTTEKKTTESTKKNSDGSTVDTTKTETTVGGKTTTVVREVTTSTSGEATIVTTTTDADGKTTVKTDMTKSYKYYIQQGIDNLKANKYDEAVTSFNTAYGLEVNNETRVYSALATLAKVATNSKTAEFVKKHLGIANYPTTLDKLFDKNQSWLKETEYVNTQHTGSVVGYEGFSTTRPMVKHTLSISGIPELTTTVPAGTFSGYIMGRIGPNPYVNATIDAIPAFRYYRVDIAPRTTSSSSTVYASSVYVYNNELSMYVKVDDNENYKANKSGTGTFSQVSYYAVTPNNSGAYYVSAENLPSSVSTAGLTAYYPKKYVTVGSVTQPEYKYVTYETVETVYTGDAFYRVSISEPVSYSSSTSMFDFKIYGNIPALNVYTTMPYIEVYNKSQMGETGMPWIYYRTVTLDENGVYYVPAGSLPSSISTAGATPYYPSTPTQASAASAVYLGSNELVVRRYTYKTTMNSLKLNAVPDWFKSSSLSNQFEWLLLANILDGNVTGLNTAVDELYDILFSSEYLTACERIDALTGAVTVPQDAVTAFKLDKIWGDGANIDVGKTELLLIKTSLQLMKGALEYVQSLQLNEPLDLLKFDWAWNDKTAFIANLKTRFGAYNAGIDPLANGFLGTRNESKLVSAKANFITVCDDLIAAYDDVLVNSTAYPTVVKDKINEYKVFRAGAVALRTAIQNGGTFAIPKEMPSGSVWPEYNAANAGIVCGIDFGAFFAKDAFKLDNFIAKANDGKPEFTLGVMTKKSTSYTYSQQTGYQIVTINASLVPTTSISYTFTNENGLLEDKTLTLTSSVLNNNSMDVLKQLAALASKGIIGSNYVCYVTVPVSKIRSLLGVDANEINMLNQSYLWTEIVNSECFVRLPVSLEVGLWIYNFYYNGAITAELTTK